MEKRCACQLGRTGFRRGADYHATLLAGRMNILPANRLFRVSPP